MSWLEGNSASLWKDKADIGCGNDSTLQHQTKDFEMIQITIGLVKFSVIYRNWKLQKMLLLFCESLLSMATIPSWACSAALSWHLIATLSSTLGEKESRVIGTKEGDRVWEKPVREMEPVTWS